MAKIDILLEALGPKCFTTMSIDKNDNHEMRIPPSRARYSVCTNVLLAKMFIAITEITKSATTGAGMDRSNIFVSVPVPALDGDALVGACAAHQQR